MRRDMDLIRDFMLALEALPGAISALPKGGAFAFIESVLICYGSLALFALAKNIVAETE